MVRCFLVCSGLGRVRRGFETFTRDCFDALRGTPGLDLRLFKGAGAPAEGEVTAWSVARDSLAANLVGRAFRLDGRWAEQATFAASLLRPIEHHDPDVIVFSDVSVGNALWHWKRRTGQRYRLLFSNGGPLPPPFPRWDHVHQVSPVHYDEAVRLGQPPQTMTLLPYGLRIGPQLGPTGDAPRRAAREKLSLPLDRPVVLAVGALLRVHKRMDYLIEEVARLPSPRPYLVMLGQTEWQTPEIVALAARVLGPDGFRATSVSRAALADYYAAADVFTLASLTEGFGLVFVEAMAAGLPCVAHDHGTARYLLGEFGVFGDLTVPGNLATLLARVLASPGREADRAARHRSVYDRFSWDRLRGRYADMMVRCAAGPDRFNGDRRRRRATRTS